jgi:plasmid stabilization system protein ParE
VPQAFYVLTLRAEADLRAAQAWSRARWGPKLTDRYFEDLHEGAQYVGQNQASLRSRHDLAGGTALFLYPVREHYLVYEPLAPRLVAIVAVIRQARDIPTLLRKWAAPIRRELAEIRARISRGEIRIPKRTGTKSRKKK